MCRRIFLSIVCLLAALWSASAQTMSQSEQDALISRIAEVTGSFTSITCSFTQVRDLSMMDQPVKSTGKMYYKASDKLRLDYLSPEQMSYIISGTAFTTIVGQKSQTADLSSTKRVSGMFNFIMSCVTGSCIADKTSFTSTARKDGNNVIVNLVPVRKDIKQMFTSLEITFDSKSCCAKTIVMNEKGGNVTTLNLTDVRTGAPVSDSLFQ